MYAKKSGYRCRVDARTGSEAHPVVVMRRVPARVVPVFSGADVENHVATLGTGTVPILCNKHSLPSFLSKLVNHIGAVNPASSHCPGFYPYFQECPL